MKQRDIRLISLDLDGTLLNSKKELSEVNYRALETAARQGIQIVPTTGRFYDAMPAVIRQLPFVNYVIAINGAEVRDLHSGEILYRAEIPWRQAIEIMTYLDTLPVIYDCFMYDGAWMTDSMQQRVEEFTDDPHFISMLRELRKPVPELKAFLTQRARDIQKTQLITMDQPLRRRLLAEIPEMFPGVITSSAYIGNVEINQSHANKGEAMLALAEYLGITQAQTMAFGDGLNDLSMIKAAGVGVVMGNAFDEVKEHADYITLSCDEDGVADALKKFGLI